MSNTVPILAVKLIWNTFDPILGHSEVFHRVSSRKLQNLSSPFKIHNFVQIRATKSKFLTEVHANDLFPGSIWSVWKKSIFVALRALSKNRVQGIDRCIDRYRKKCIRMGTIWKITKFWTWLLFYSLHYLLLQRSYESMNICTEPSDGYCRQFMGLFRKNDHNCSGLRARTMV